MFFVICIKQDVFVDCFKVFYIQEFVARIYKKRILLCLFFLAYSQYVFSKFAQTQCKVRIPFVRRNNAERVDFRMFNCNLNCVHNNRFVYDLRFAVMKLLVHAYRLFCYKIFPGTCVRNRPVRVGTLDKNVAVAFYLGKN